MIFYGNYAGPSGAGFRVCAELVASEQGDDQYRVSARYWIEAANDFYGTLMHTSWFGDVSVSSPGTYADTGWVDWGWCDWGKAVDFSLSAWYTGGSGAEYSSSASSSFLPDTPVLEPYAPSGVANARVSDTSNAVSWTRNAHAARPYASQTVQRSVDGGAWADLKSGLSGTATSYSDSSTSAGHSYAYRVKAVNSAGSASSASSAKTLNTPSKPSGVANARVSDTSNAVSWTRNCPDPDLYASQSVQRSMDGGSWATVASGLSGTAASWTDTTTSANHRYAYRVGASNSAGTAWSDSSATTYNTPSAPGSPSASRSSDSRVYVSWTAASAAALLTGYKVQRSVDGGSWADIGTAAASATSYADTTTSANHRYAYRVAAYNSAGSSAWASTGTVYTTPAAPSGASASRCSDSRVDVSWTAVALQQNVSGYKVQRSVDGGAWADLATAAASASSYSDTSTAANRSYAYRVAAANAAGTSGWSATGTVYTTPASPTVSSASRGSSNDVVLSIASNAPHATSMEVQRNAAGTDSWDTCFSGAVSASVADTPGGGTWRYRARNLVGSLASAWSAASSWVTSMAPPDAPTITSPASGSVLPVGRAVQLAFVHNPVDGSAQTAAQVEASTDGGSTWSAVAQLAGETSAQYTPAVSGDVLWRARTAGVSGEYGPWASSTICARVAPQVSVSVDAVVRAVPFTVSWSQGPADGSVASSSLTVVDAASGEEVLSRSLGAGSTSLSVEAEDLVPSDGGSYEARVEVRSTTGLYGSGSASFSVSYDAPGTPSVSLAVDEAEGAVYVSVRSTASTVPTEYLLVEREGEVLSARSADGDTVRDGLPALDRPVAYRVVAVAESGAASEAVSHAVVPSRSRVFFSFGGRTAKLLMSARVGEQRRKDAEVMDVIGRPRPVSMYGERVSCEGTVTGDVWWEAVSGRGGAGETKEAFDALSEWLGDAVMRCPHAEPRTVSCDVSTELGRAFGLCSVTVSWKEVDG